MSEKILPSDRFLAILTCALVLFGVVMVYDASFPHALAHYGDGWYFVKRQFVSAVLGLIAFRVCSRFHYRHWAGVPSLLLYTLAIGMLVVVCLFGHGALGGQRWIKLGPVQFQPSEFAKLALILWLADYLARNQKMLHDFKTVAIGCGAAFIPILLTERQPDLGTAMIMFIAFLAMLLVSGVRKSWVALIIVASVLAAGATVLMPGKKQADTGATGGGNYRAKRVLAFLHPEDYKDDISLQNWHSLVALGNGGITGVGFTKSMEKRVGGLPMQRTDFIYSVVGEEFGLIGTSALLLAYFLMAVRGYSIACRSREPMGQLLAVGVTTLVCGQAAINIAVVTSSMPTTGIPLPLISYGGSALIPTLAGIGILLNVSRLPYRKEKAPTTETRPSEAILRGFGAV